MKYIEIEKRKLSKITFTVTYLGLLLISFLYAFVICLILHIIYYGEYPTDIWWSLFVFSGPPIITIFIVFIVYYYTFKKYYIEKSLLINYKEISGYISVFLLVIINSLVKFYTPTQSSEADSKKSYIINELEEFFEITLTDINYTYTVPILFSMSTIIMYIFEKWNHSHSKIYRKKIVEINIKKIESPVIQKCNAIIKEMEGILEESKNVLDKYRTKK